MFNSQLIVNQTGDTIEAILPMEMPYCPVPAFLAGTPIGMIFLLCRAIYRKLCTNGPPPRARFVIRSQSFRMEFVDRKNGHKTTRHCDPTRITEFRKNQYGKGLYVRIRGKATHTYLEDYSDDAVIEIAAQVRELLNSRLGLTTGTTTTQ